MMMTMMRSFLLALLAATAVGATDDTVLVVNNVNCDSWSVSDFSYSCNGDNNECGYGNTLQASGSIQISSSFTADEEVDITLKAGKWGVSVVTIGQSSQKICDFLTPSGGTCGVADTYTFSESVNIPDEQMLQTFLSYMSVTAKIIIEDTDGSTISTCSATVKATASSSSYSMVASSVVVGSLLVGAGLYGMKRRRRIIQDESLKQTLTDFEMAPDPMNRAVSV